ncbi:hypothetical protein BDN71DRAFT_1434205 [Pleurotus eryngii]|uniref:Uncharacterized protein n=1 Tax=Pleurotus eryngii TaxID=5323 RepID=A0A9P6DBT1_PLEER|nr:hypothetical protein BDN71DRAFT_1434205 [Pleurotus eryngii]
MKYRSISSNVAEYRQIAGAPWAEHIPLGKELIYPSEPPVVQEEVDIARCAEDDVHQLPGTSPGKTCAGYIMLWKYCTSTLKLKNRRRMANFIPRGTVIEQTREAPANSSTSILIQPPDRYQGHNELHSKHKRPVIRTVEVVTSKRMYLYRRRSFLVLWKHHIAPTASLHQTVTHRSSTCISATQRLMSLCETVRQRYEHQDLKLKLAFARNLPNRRHRTSDLARHVSKS